MVQIAFRAGKHVKKATSQLLMIDWHSNELEWKTEELSPGSAVEKCHKVKLGEKKRVRAERRKDGICYIT